MNQTYQYVVHHFSDNISHFAANIASDKNSDGNIASNTDLTSLT